MKNTISKQPGQFDTLISDDRKINGMLMSNRTTCEVSIGASKYNKSKEDKDLLRRMKKSSTSSFSRTLTNRF